VLPDGSAEPRIGSYFPLSADVARLISFAFPQGGRYTLRHLLVLTTVALVIVVGMPPWGVGWAAEGPTNCAALVNANPAGGGEASPGETGDRARRSAEANHEQFGQGTAESAQLHGFECEGLGSPGPPGPFDPKAN
jgi:hypothetical protein